MKIFIYIPRTTWHWTGGFHNGNCQCTWSYLLGLDHVIDQTDPLKCSLFGTGSVWPQWAQLSWRASSLAQVWCASRLKGGPRMKWPSTTEMKHIPQEGSHHWEGLHTFPLTISLQKIRQSRRLQEPHHYPRPQGSNRFICYFINSLT